MVLVYDLRRDARRRKAVLLGIDDQWKAYLRGELEVDVMSGKISELFYASYEGEHMFRLDEGNKTSAWIRFGDSAWYVVGRSVKVECAKFRASEPIGNMPIVTRIWIGKNE